MHNNRILIADDEPDIGDVISSVAEDLGFDTTFVEEGSVVVGKVESIKPSVIVLDLRMPGADGVEILRELAAQSCNASIVLISGMDQRTLNTVETLGREKNLNIIATLSKPMHPDQIEAVLKPLSEGRSEGDSAPAPKYFADDSDLVYGPGVYFWPQKLMNGGDTARRRIGLEGSWRLDNGEVVSGDKLFLWAREKQLGKGILSLILRQSLQQWQYLGDAGENLQLVLPLEPHMLEDKSLVEVITQSVKSFGFATENLIIETDEKDIHRTGSHAIEALSRLRIAGFRTAFITDSGTDELLTMIDKLPMDEIVVDMSALARRSGIGTDMELEFAYSSLTSMARKKDVVTCASNVSTAELAEFVKRCQFEWAEGAEIVRQMPISELVRYYS